MKEEIAIAIVDDNDVNRTLISKMLDGISNVSKKSEFEDGLQIVKAVEGGERFDLILMDVQMPNMDGYEACRSLRDMEYNGKIILATGSTGHETFKKMQSSGCDDMIPKPIRTEDLEKKIWKYFPLAVMSKRRQKEKAEVSLINESIGMEEVEIDTLREEVAKSDSNSEEKSREENQLQEESISSELIEKAVQKMEDEMGMDQEVAVGMISDYIRFLKRKTRALNEALAKKSEIGIRKVAHDLTGSGEMYGFDEVSELGREMSKLMNQKDFDGAGKLVSKLRNFVSMVEKQLKNFQLS